MLSKKMKIFIAGVTAAFVILVGAGIYLVSKDASQSKNDLNTKSINQSVNSNAKKPNTHIAEGTSTITKTGDDSQDKQAKTTTKKTQMKTSPVLNETINTNENTSVSNINYPSLFQATFGYQYKYPQMVGDKSVNFLKALTLFQLAQVQAMVPFTASTIKNNGSLPQYKQQLEQLEDNTNTLLAMISTINKNSTDSTFNNFANQFNTINLTISSALSSEITSMNLFNAGYSRLNTLPFGANMQKYINELNSLNTSLGSDNTAATSWLNQASNAYVMYQGPLAPSGSVTTSSSTSIKQQ